LKYIKVHFFYKKISDVLIVYILLQNTFAAVEIRLGPRLVVWLGLRVG